MQKFTDGQTAAEQKVVFSFIFNSGTVKKKPLIIYGRQDTIDG